MCSMSHALMVHRNARKWEEGVLKERACWMNTGAGFLGANSSGIVFLEKRCLTVVINGCTWECREGFYYLGIGMCFIFRSGHVREQRETPPTPTLFLHLAVSRSAPSWPPFQETTAHTRHTSVRTQSIHTLIPHWHTHTVHTNTQYWHTVFTLLTFHTFSHNSGT